MNPREIIRRIAERFRDGWRKLTSRLNLWSRKGEAAFAVGQVESDAVPGAPEPLFRWELGNTEEHCRDCLDLNGQVLTAARWREIGIKPQSPDLECGGWNCDCRLVQLSPEEAAEYRNSQSGETLRI